ncbi:MAG TPA: ATP-binding protein [Actinomycetaceae bacterium]|nr:ATP-binding protein [Actinomycetaceae bacterium]
MEFAWDVMVAAIVGLLIGAVSTWAFFSSERERQQETSELSEDLSQDEAAMLAAFHESALVLGPHDEVLRANAPALQFGLARRRRLAHPEILRLVSELRKTGHAQAAEFGLRRGRAGSSSMIYLAVAVAPLTRDRVIVLGRDQTPSRRLDQTRRDFVANVSHELKTPVGAIGLLAETVEEHADEPDVVARFSKQMKREATRLATLVQEIIDLSRLQEPDALKESTIVDVDDVIAEAMDRVRVEAESHSITLVRGGTEDLQVLGNENLLTTAVRNLLENAIHYSPDKSKVSVGVRASDGIVKIAVVDQGIGIPSEAHDRVFERFYRVDSARSRATGGTGLGLSIVKHIAADHGGEVTLWSKPGRGSTLTLEIPQFTAQQADEELPEAAATRTEGEDS